MSIERIRHGAEISSAKLNEIIEAVNENTNDHTEIRQLSLTIEDKLKAVYSKLEQYSEQVGEHLDSIPEVRELYAAILLARDSVDWVDISTDQTDTNAAINAALNSNDQEAHRLRIIRGTTSQITLNTPAIKDKQVLIAYDATTNKGIMYFDIGNIRIPVSASEDVVITAMTPTFSFQSDINTGEEFMVIEHPDNTITRSGNLKGSTGAPGIQGVQGPQGPKGERGEQGTQGRQGDRGQDGVSTLISIWFSDYESGLYATENYNNHKYMGIKTYLSTDDAATMYARPIKWFRISGDTMYPIYNKETGYLTFTTTKPNVSSFYIKGDQGDPGPKGEPPVIAFRKADGSLIELTAIDEGDKFIYDATAFKGDKGDSGPTGPTGLKGRQGEQGIQGPQGPKGPDGRGIMAVNISDDGVLTITYSDGVTTSFNGLKGEKGDPATIAIKGAKDSKELLPTENISVGDAYAVASTVNGVAISELYICVNINGRTVDEIYRNLGNIKGEKGDKGNSGATWHTGTDIADNITDQYLEQSFNAGDYYLNTSTGDIFKIVSAQDNIYTALKLGSLKGNEGPVGAQGVSINRIEVTPETADNILSKTYQVISDQGTILGLFTVHNGLNGSRIYTSTVAPTNDIGSDNDIFINTATTELYQKLSGTWGTPKATLKGEPGTRGPQISVISGVPSSTSGYIEGDLCIDQNTSLLYELRSGVWEQRIKLRGQDGSRGPKIITHHTTPSSAEDCIEGDVCIALDTSSLYKLNSSLVWDYIGNLRGATGAVYTPSVSEDGVLSWTNNGTGLSNPVPVTIKGPQGIPGPAGAYTTALKETDDSSAIGITLLQSVYYEFTNTAITSISVTFGTIEENTVGEFLFEFTIASGGTPPTISLPSGVKYANNWEHSDFEAGHKYVIYIINNIAYVSFVSI